MKRKIKPRILIVDDEPTFRKYLADALREVGYTIITAPNGMESIKEIKEKKPDIVLTDMILPDISGLKILELTKEFSPSTDVIMITGYATMDTAIRALKMGASDYITKPVSIEALKITIKKYLDKKEILNENIELLNRFKLIEELKNLSIYNNIESFLTGLTKIIKEHLKFQKSFSCVTVQNKPQIITTSGISKERALDFYLKYAKRSVKNIHTGKSVIFKLNKDYSAVISLGGKNKRGYLVLLNEKNQIGTNEEEILNVIAGYASVYFRSIVDIDEAKYLSYIDDLTELYNPRYLKIVINKEIKKNQTNKTQFSILFLDLDHFKEVNDTYGHLIGGEILCEVAKVLKNSVRNADVVVRYGGDEYVIVLFNTDRAKAQIIAERIRKNIENHIFLGREGYRIRLTTCIGVSTYPEDGRTYKKLIESADRSMYIGKNEGRNAVHFASELRNR